MPQFLLTDAKIRKAKPRASDYLLSDGDGLSLRVRAGGRASNWFFYYTLDGRQRRRSLGVFPGIGLAVARKLAADCRALVADKKDPVEAERTASGERKAERQRRKTRHTVRTLFEEWQRRELAASRKDKGASARAAFERDVFKRYGDRFADELTKPDIQAIIDKVAERGARHSANVVRGLLRKMFAFALDRDIIPADPTARVRKLEGADKVRTRVLSSDEIRELAGKLPASGLPPRYQAAAWIMLATCARVGELSKARWDDLNLEVGTWTIPAENAKNGREHVIHLSGFARRHFESLPRLAGCEWVYYGRDSSAPVERQTLQKEYRDRQRDKPLKRRSVKPGALRLSGGEWTAHDLRRTGATLMGELGIRPEVIDRCLNHVAASKVTRTYQHQEMQDDRRRAFQRLGECLKMILSAEPGKVAIFPATRRA